MFIFGHETRLLFIFLAALRSEVGQLRKAADAAERLAQEAQKQLAGEN
jgi:hypothetical protein